MEHRAWTAEAPAELRAETWVARREVATFHDLVITSDGSATVASLLPSMTKSARLSPERVSLGFRLRARGSEPDEAVVGLRYAVFAKPPFPDSGEERGPDATRRRLEGTPLATGGLSAGPAEEDRVLFTGSVEVPARADDPLPSYTVSFLLVTSKGFRRKVVGVSGGGPFVDRE